jgi:hypothetical protein
LKPYAAERSPSSRRNQSVIWLQLAGIGDESPLFAIDRLTEGRSFDQAVDLLFDLNPRPSAELTACLLVGFIYRLVTNS